MKFNSEAMRLQHPQAACTHLDEPLEELMAFTTRLKIKLNDCLSKLALPFGNITFFEAVISRLNQSEGALLVTITSDDFYVCRCAAENGDLQLLKRLASLIQSVSPQRLADLLSAGDFSAFKLAAHHAHLLIVICYCLFFMSPMRATTRVAPTVA